MSDWSTEELDEIGSADELQITSLRSDGSPRPYVTIWVVRVRDDLYVRSWRGRNGGWYRHAVQRGQGRIYASGVERDVTFSEPDNTVHDAIDHAYRTKYARYGNTYVEPMVSAEAKATTLKLMAR